MNNLNLFLSRSLRWIGFEALSYQFILLGHQLLLFKVADYSIYGLIGTVFSLVYLAVSVADMGLEPSISPFFGMLCKNKYKFRRFFIRQLVPGSFFVISVLLIFCMVKWFLNPAFLSFVTIPLLFVVGILALCETIKRTLRTVLHLAFLNREVAFLEVGTIVAYVFSVWFFYGCGVSVGLPLIFVPMMLTSFFSTIIMIFYLHRFSCDLPESGDFSLANVRIYKNRGFNFLNQLSHTFFSSNFLVPFFAMQFGFASAGVFKLVSHVSYGITSIIRKIFGLTSDAMLSKTKHMSSKIKQEVFSLLTHRLHHVLYGVLIFFFINYNKLLSHSGPTQPVIQRSLLFLFFVICLSESFFIAYEKLYIMQEQVGKLFSFNLVTMLLTYGVIYYSSILSSVGVLFSIIGIRVCMFVSLSVLSSRQWNITSSWRIRPKYLFAAITLSLCFFILF